MGAEVGMGTVMAECTNGERGVARVVVVFRAGGDGREAGASAELGDTNACGQGLAHDLTAPSKMRLRI
jgi:hypothetical protein